MRRYLLVLGGSVFLGLGGAAAQTLSNASLSGRYYFVQLMVTAIGGQAVDSFNLGGTINFNGMGGYTYTGRLGVGEGALGANTGQGTYTVAADGSVTLSNPIRSNLRVNARMSADSNLLLGATTEASDNTNDIFVAIKAPTANLTNAALNGAYTGATLAFPGGASTGRRSAVVSLAAGGNGQFSRATVIGHAADQGGRNASQEATGATYNLNTDGSGSANFGAAAGLFSGARDIFVSQDGNYMLGMSTATGYRDILVATKNFGAAATAAALSGRYWIAEMTVEGSSFSAASGALSAQSTAPGAGRVLFYERLHLDTRPTDFSGVNSYSVNADSTGNLSPLPVAGVNNMALGAPVMVGGAARANTLVGAQIGVVNEVTTQYGIFFCIRAPTFSGAGVFLDPNGVVNGASFAPAPNPIAPGAIVSLFGSGLAPREGQAATLPLPTTLEGVSVAVNGTAAPLFFVSAGQVNIQAPFGLTGNTARIQVTNGGTRSNEVTVPLAATSPGIFSYNDTQSPAGTQSPARGIILHANFSLVTPQSPARPGETVIIYLNGLGALSPEVATGAGNPSSPLATAADRQIQILFGSEVATSAPFIGGAPTFVGLNQINVVVPATAPAGPNVPVAISTGNAFHDIVDIAIGI